MDPEDLALLRKLIGRSPQADQQPLSDGQMMAEVLRRHIAANAQPGDLPPQPIDPEQLAQSRLHAEALGRYQQSLRTGEPFPASPDPGSAGAGDPFPGAAFDASSPALPGPAATQPPGVQLLSSTIDAADLPKGSLFAPSNPWPQPPSEQTRAAAGAELLRRGLTPDADYVDPANDALANLARGRAAPSGEQPPPLSVAPGPSNNPAPPLPDLSVGPHGYKPMAGDQNELARLIFAEGGVSEDLPAISWSIVNRVGSPEFGGTLNEVRDQTNAFASVPKGGSAQYRLTAHPSLMDPISAKKWQRAEEISKGILNGLIPDPTGGAQYFFSSNHYNGDPETAPGDYPNMLPNLHASPYQGRADVSGRKSYFFIKNRRK